MSLNMMCNQGMERHVHYKVISHTIVNDLGLISKDHVGPPDYRGSKSVILSTTLKYLLYSVFFSRLNKTYGNRCGLGYQELSTLNK